MTIFDVPSGHVWETSEGFEYWLDSGGLALAQIGIMFKAKGYKTIKTDMQILSANPHVVLEQSSNKILLAAAASMLYFLAAKDGKRGVGELNLPDLLPYAAILIGVFGFTIVKELFEKLGIWDSKETKLLDNASTDPDSFWNPLFWSKIPNGSNYSHSLSNQQAFDLAGKLYNSFGPFNDNEEQAIGVFKSYCKTQANASFICYWFGKRYNMDCLTFLRGGSWPQDRLSDSDVNNINQFISNLPKW